MLTVVHFIITSNATRKQTLHGIFLLSFKQEEIYRTSYRSLEDCKTHIADYMQFYNENRPHRANNYKSPNQTEEAYYKKNPAVQSAGFRSRFYF